MPELLQRETKELHRFPGLMERPTKVPEVTQPQKTPETTPKTESESVSKKRGRPRKTAVDESTPTRKKGIDTKSAKVL